MSAGHVAFEIARVAERPRLCKSVYRAAQARGVLPSTGNCVPFAPTAAVSLLPRNTANAPQLGELGHAVAYQNAGSGFQRVACTVELALSWPPAP